MKTNNIENMSKQEKIQILQTIASGKQTITQILSKLLPDKVIVVREQPDGLHHNEKLYTPDGLKAVIEKYKKAFNLTVIRVKRGARNSSESIN